MVVESDPKYSGKYNLPGGKCNVGETRHACAIREVMEEVNVDLNGGDFELVGEHASEGHGGDSQKTTVFVYVTREQPATTPQTSEIQSCHWIDYDELINMDESKN
eukprot:COSAG01_NODE_7251_length_3282_cov_6.586868_2_plen_105_part_00